MTTAHITPADHRDELVDAALALLARQLPSQPIANLWTEPHRIAFLTADGRTGDVEVLVNWDVVTTESTANRSVP
jgi:hypothetical protein